MNSEQPFFFFFFSWSRALESFLLRPEAYLQASEAARDNGMVWLAVEQRAEVRRRGV